MGRSAVASGSTVAAIMSEPFIEEQAVNTIGPQCVPAPADQGVKLQEHVVCSTARHALPDMRVTGSNNLQPRWVGG